MRNLNRIDDAISSFDKVFELSLSNVDANITWGNVFRSLERRNDVLISYDEIITLNPVLSDAHNN